MSDRYERKYPELKVYIAQSIWRQTEALQMKSLLPLLMNPRYGYFPQVGDALMERSRGINATHFLRHTNADVYFSLDSDIVDFNPQHIDEMVEQAVTHDIVAGVYLCKSVARTFPATLFEDETSIEFNDDPTPVEVKWAATGCIAIHRRVFEKLAETMPLLHEKDGPRAFYPFFRSSITDLEDVGPILLSEDFAFCERAREAGFKVYVNPRVRLGHMGPYVYRLEDMGQNVLTAQPLTISRSGAHWRIELEGTVETPEAMGRIRPGEAEAVDEKFARLNREQRRKKKSLTAV